MRYNTITKTLFGHKLAFVDSYGNIKEEFKLPKNSPFKLKPAKNGCFCFMDKAGTMSKPLMSAELEGKVLTCHTTSNTKFKINYETGAISPEYVYEVEKHIVALDGRVYKFDEFGNTSLTQYFVPTTSTGEFKDNRIARNQFVFRNAAGKYVLLNCKMEKVIDMEFDTPVITVTYKDDPIRVYSAGKKQYICNKSGEVLKSVDSKLKFHKFTSYNPLDNNVRFAAYDLGTNSTIVYNYDVEENVVKVETTLNNRVVSRYVDNRKLLYVTQNEDGKYGVVTRLDKNVIPHIYDSITRENLKLRYLNSQMVVCDRIFKVGIESEEGIKYGAYNTEGRSILPTKYSKIDLTESTKLPDGNYRFVVSNVGDYYGVVDSKGNTIVPLKYLYFPEEKTVVSQRTGKGTSIERIMLERPNGQKEYMNTFAENVLATDDEKKSITTIYPTQKETKSFVTYPERSIYGATFTSDDDDVMGD